MLALDRLFGFVFCEYIPGFFRNFSPQFPWLQHFRVAAEAEQPAFDLFGAVEVEFGDQAAVFLGC